MRKLTVSEKRRTFSPGRKFLGGLLLVLTCVPAVHAGNPATTDADVLAPGWRPLEYPAPVPGSYELPPLGDAANGDVLDRRGNPRRLHEIFDDRIVLMSFIYLSCPDVNACPMAMFVMSGVERRIREHPAARKRVRLISLSFDPVNDRPEALRAHARHLVPEGADWHLLTTASEEALSPILDAYDQWVSREHGPDGEPLATISHVLRVFLIDADKQIRNIYSSSFLHADTVWSDIRTLLMESEPDRPVPARRPVSPALHGAGDERSGYTGADYETRSRSLQERRGKQRDLLGPLSQPPLGLPPIPVPEENPMTLEKAQLGRKLFFDRRLSHNHTMSCAMCHVPEQGFTVNEMATAVGIEGQTVRRNAPTLYNAAYAKRLFHDAREGRLERQIWAPLLASNEMGNPSVGYVLEKLERLPDYEGRFEAAFAGRGPSMETLGMALASYERTLVSGNSSFDRWHFGGEETALGEEARRGFELFRGRAGCASCHTIGESHALFTDHRTHNTGIGYRQTMGPPAGERSVPVAPGTFLRFDPAVIAAASEPVPNDLGAYEVTGRPEDRWKFKTPSLRNVALTAPYMHDGSIPTLRDVVEHYDRGGVPNPLLDPAIEPLGLDDAEIDALVSFLESLTGDNVDEILSDAFAAPIGDPGTGH